MKYIIPILILLILIPQVIVGQEVSLGGRPKTVTTKEEAALPTSVVDKDDRIIELLQDMVVELKILNTYHSIMVREEITIDEINYKGE